MVAATMAAMAASGTAAVVTALSFGAEPWVTTVVAAIWGLTVVADSAQFSTAVTELRAGVIIGSGSAWFEMVRHTTELLPQALWLASQGDFIGAAYVI